MARVIPAQLEADVEDFTGRQTELAALDKLLLDRQQDVTAAIISAVSGTAGVGKTALALRWAHRVKRHFVDGQLYVNLRGFDSERPLRAIDVLAGFLRALGKAAHEIPSTLDECSAAYRSLLDGRRMLIVLDNASTTEQVRPLLPGTGSCAVLVTSRDALSGLVARHGARRLDLDLLPAPDALALLHALIGTRVKEEAESASRLAELCARLPLALRVAAELIAGRPTESLSDLVHELASEPIRLELLDAGGDARTAVRAVFSWSYKQLTPDDAEAFRRIGLHPGPDFDAYAAAALFHETRDRTLRLLANLSRAHLVQRPRRDRYSMHDLLRTYAVHLACEEDSEPERREALTRLFDYYLATAASAMDVLIPAQRHRRPRIAPPDIPLPPLSEPATARPWLDAERASLVAIFSYTASHGWASHAARLASTLYRYLEAGARFANGLTIHTHALEAARLTGEVAAEADALLNLGSVYWQQGRFDKATDYLQQALILSRTNGDRIVEGRALLNLGLVDWQQGNLEQSINHLDAALTLSRETGDRVREARALASLGAIFRRQGDYDSAAEYDREAVALARAIGDRVSEAYGLAGLGAIYRRQGLYVEAANHYNQALNLGREIGDRVCEARALAGFGAIAQRQGRYEESSEQYQQALALFREVGDRHGETHALNCLGESLLAGQQVGEARAHFRAALALAVQIGQRYEEAHAHDGLGRLCYSGGDRGQARYHWTRALALYTDLQVPNAYSVQKSLGEL